MNCPSGIFDQLKVNSFSRPQTYLNIFRKYLHMYLYIDISICIYIYIYTHIFIYLCTHMSGLGMYFFTPNDN